jgi:hypothetical protein
LKLEVVPCALLALALVLYKQYKPEIQNALLGNGRFGLEALTQNDERFVAKKLSGLLKYSY